MPAGHGCHHVHAARAAHAHRQTAEPPNRLTMYSYVPHTVLVFSPGARCLASPKSVSLMWPLVSSKIFSGLRSRYTTPTAWIWLSAPEAPNRPQRRITSTNQHPISRCTKYIMAHGACVVWWGDESWTDESWTDEVMQVR